MTFLLKNQVDKFIELKEHLKDILDQPEDAEKLAIELLKVYYLERLENKFLKQESKY